MTPQTHPRIANSSRENFSGVDVNNGKTWGKTEFSKKSQGLNENRCQGGQQLDSKACSSTYSDVQTGFSVFESC